MDLENVDLTNNSLKNEIEEMVDICNRLEEIEDDEIYTAYREPATEEMLTEWEKENDIVLPEEYKDFLRFTDGARIAAYTALFVSVEGIRANSKLLPPEYVLVGDYGGYGALMCFSKTTGEFITYEQGKTEHYGSFKNLIVDIIDSLKGQLPSDDSGYTMEELDKMFQKILEERRKNGKNILKH
ncbi:MAG: SMI1/KNR4 family protein [Peptostreptococcaceae bacterium]|nr:SMI1/KNR4 family protein [Peptostreptococcaceae bacterium]